MKKLQSNYTTTEQSKRLLELGVPADSADLFYHKGGKWVSIFQMEDKTSDFPARFERTPCWSVGRLIEIYCLCVDEMYSVEFIGQIHTKPMNKILDMLGYVKLDFSKLEEYESK